MLFRPAATAERLKVTIHGELPASWPSASSLGEARCHIFQTREFIEAWGMSFGPIRCYRPIFVEITDADDRTLLLLPLVLERRGSVTVLGFIDQGQADYNAPVLYPAVTDHLDAFTPVFWEGLFAVLPHFDLLRLEKMPAEVDGLPNPMLGLSTGAHAQSCHGNDLGRPLPEIEAVLLSPKELRSKQRGLEKIAPVRFIVAEDAATRARLLERLIAQKQRRFEETRVPGFAERPQTLTFLREADRHFAAGGHSFICALEVGEEITAAQWGLVHGKHFYALVTGFEGGAWTKFSCGRILNLRLLQWLSANGFTYFDQGYGDEAYKLRGTDTTVALLDAVVPRTFRGRLRLRREAVLARLKALPVWERLRQLKWQLRRGLRRSTSVVNRG